MNQKIKSKEKHAYIFPSPMASIMKKIDMKTQYESGLFSQALLLLGMVLMTIYTIIYIDQGLVFKILLVINLIAGFIFMSSFMVTTYQQYDSYLGALEIQGISPDANVPTKKNRKNQIFFFGGLVFTIAGIMLLLADYSWRFIVAGSCITLGLIMIALVFRKRKSNIKEEPLSIAAKKVLLPSEKEAMRKELLTNIQEGLSTLKKMDNIEENRIIRKMMADVIKSDMDKLKDLNAIKPYQAHDSQTKPQTNPMKGGIYHDRF